MPPYYELEVSELLIEVSREAIPKGNVVIKTSSIYVCIPYTEVPNRVVRSSESLH